MRKRIVERKEYATVELAIPRLKTPRVLIMLSRCVVRHISTTSHHPIDIVHPGSILGLTLCPSPPGTVVPSSRYGGKP
jgi:hypothetical protein